MAALNPIDNPQDYDFIVVGSARSPGICRPFEPKRKHEWDVKKGKGVRGATVTYVGQAPAQWDVVFELWQASHWDDWASFATLLKYDSTKKAVQAIDIYHPSLAEVDIKSVVVEAIGAITHEGKGLYTRTVSFLEYFPPPKLSAVSTPAGSQTTSPGAAGGGRGGRPTADQLEAAAAQREIAEREATVADLANKAAQP